MKRTCVFLAATFLFVTASCGCGQTDTGPVPDNAGKGDIGSGETRDSTTQKDSQPAKKRDQLQQPPKTRKKDPKETPGLKKAEVKVLVGDADTTPLVLFGPKAYGLF